MPIVGLLVRELAGFRNQFRPWRTGHGGDRVSSICCLQTHFIGRRDIDGNSYSNPGNPPPSPNNQTSPTMFIYSPLSREKRETRVFRFTPPRQSGSDRISLELRHASLDDDSLQYRALPYVWGDTKDKEDININGERFSVGANLHALLQMLQHHDVASWLWADAISIHQSDDDEKSWHVQSMCDMFKNAEFVYSWLGLGSEATDVAMEFFSDWGPRALKVGVMEKLWPTNMPMDWSFMPRYEVSRFWYSLERYFLPEPVFEKGGTVDNALSMDCERYEMARFFYDLLHLKGLRGTREKSKVALAREVLLLCGEKLLRITYFEAVLEAPWKFGEERATFLNNCPLRCGFCERFPSHLYPNKATLIRQLLCRRMEVSLGTILVAFSNQSERIWYRATDSRDIVYGILGLLSHDDRRPFGHVDYTNTTWVDLLTHATRSLIEASFTSGFLTNERMYTIGHCLPRPRDQPSELPSWVPDWRDVDVMEYDYQAGNIRESDRPSDWLTCIREFAELPESSDIWSLEGEDYVWRLVMNCHDTNFLWLRLKEHKYKTEAACFIRRLIRLDYPNPKSLPDFVVKYTQGFKELKALSNIRSSKHIKDARITKFSNLTDDTSRDATVIDDGKAQTKSKSVDPKYAPISISESDLKSFMDAEIRKLFRQARSRNSTLFKTAKGMLGIGIGDVRPGDIVVILQNAHTPFILRPHLQDNDEITTNSEGSGSTFTFGGEAWVDGIMHGDTIRYELHTFALRSQNAEQQNWE
ncbi:heterokaryon incompatibility protein-domain-containing protein [Neurospora hispaniola]|uniref:Heterokaryon incompatibility protein-domain-containing protein n=1 Tax=Neurospora hispaniola TaxID=588809 RepID=A0AAJ0I8U4_9PEZI|nr:heterokaryon incompatibility protein-domain-containing protein [Neurospora hispaniola]